MQVGWRVARVRARGVRPLYRRLSTSPTSSHHVHLDLLSFSSERDLPEQTVCIRSFLRYVGVPIGFTVVSDGSHTAEGRQWLESLHDCVRVRALGEIAAPADAFGSNLPQHVTDYLDQAPLGKKLRVLMSIRPGYPTIYCDSDIVYFAGAAELRGDRYRKGNFYLRDAIAALEPSLLRNASEAENPVNSGFLLLHRPFVWNRALERLALSDGRPGYWAEQTIVHLAAHDSGAVELDPDRFLVRLDDKWQYRDKYADDKIALRHYVAGLRPKIWTLAALRGLQLRGT